MTKHGPWVVYGGQPRPASVYGERAARKLAARYAELGMPADLYSAEGDGRMHLRARFDEDGEELELDGGERS